MSKAMIFVGTILGAIVGGSLGLASEQIEDSLRIRKMSKDGTLKDSILFADQQRRNLSLFSGNINPNPLAEQIKREQNI